MSDIKIIKVVNGGSAKVDSSGFFIKPKQTEPSQLSQFIQKETKINDYEEDEDSVDSMTVSDVSSATQQTHDEEYTNELMTPAPPIVNSIVKDETLKSYLDKPKMELPSSKSPVPAPIPVPALVPSVQTNDVSSTIVNEQVNNNNAQSTTTQPANNRNDYYSDNEEDVIDMTDNKLYDILASVLEDEDGENVSENMSKMNRNIEKVISMFEAYQQNNTKDEYLSKIGEAIENQNKILSQIVHILEKQVQPNQNNNVTILENNDEKNNKQILSSESSDKGENTDDTEKNPDIKKIKVSDNLKHSTSKKDVPLKHRIQIKRKN